MQICHRFGVVSSFRELSGLTMTALEQSFVARWPYEADIDDYSSTVVVPM